MSAPLPAPRSPLCAEAGSSLPSSLRAAHCVRPSVLPRRRVLRRRRGAAGPGPRSITVPARGSAAVRQCGRSVPGPRNPGAVPRCSACARRRGRGGQPPGSQGGPRGRQDKQPLLLGVLGGGEGRAEPHRCVAHSQGAGVAGGVADPTNTPMGHGLHPRPATGVPSACFPRSVRARPRASLIRPRTHPPGRHFCSHLLLLVPRLPAVYL